MTRVRVTKVKVECPACQKVTGHSVAASRIDGEPVCSTCDECGLERGAGKVPLAEMFPETQRKERAGKLAAVHVKDLLSFAKAYAGLGDAVAEQLDNLMSADFENVTDAAVALIEERMADLHPEIKSVCDEYHEYVEAMG